ncbi:hypothetical protein A2230_09005 [candidate division WOR-1 bacterium RIFOXYA2_FULL_36_21]|nr:MAG: hypothetical protein A2230_09005 [candidate division WOR-1 bacterium RIFOXYA2_FULL_36_21]
MLYYIILFQFIIKKYKKMKYIDFELKINSPIFTRQEIKLLSFRVFDCQLSSWQKNGYIVKIKNGVYAFSKRIDEISGEEVAQKIYSPSYLSYEKALYFYGFIPEMVYAFTLATPKTTRTFENEFGKFIYHNIKRSLFFGYVSMQGKSESYLVAEPEKAILDFLYLRKSSIKIKEDISSFRFNFKEIKEKTDFTKFKKYLKSFNNKKFEKTVKIFFETGNINA